MSKEVDNNGYWFIKHNPISKVGVFPYLGKNIDDNLEPEKIYYVFRSPETLKQSVPTWDNPPKPFIEDHEMLGEGFTNIDARPVQGINTNPQFDEKEGVLYADLAIYSEDMKNKIADGKKEISLGYFCKYEKKPGVWNGQVYDYEQVDMVGNHGALVDAGRCGSDVKVFDHKCTMDSIDINPTDFESANNKWNKNQESGKIISKDSSTEKKGEKEMADKREAIREIMAIAAKPNSDFEGGESEKIETIAKLLEKSEYAKSEAGTSNDEDDVDEEKEEMKASDKCAKDSKRRKVKDGKMKRRAKDEDEEEKESEDEDDVDDDEKKAEDEEVSASEVMAWLKQISESLAKLAGQRKTEDEDEEEKKESEDEDDDESGEKEKAAGDSVGFVFDKKKRTAEDAAEDAALKAYLAD